ncbi:MAG: ATP-dependent DNA helicase RecG [Myxococcota bacterium]
MAKRSTQRAVDELRRVLLPPLRFAQRDNYACVDRLGGFQHLVHATLRRLAPDLPESLVGRLRQLGRDFDTLSHRARRARVERLLTALQSPDTFHGNSDRLDGMQEANRSDEGKHIAPAPASRDAMNRVSTNASPAPPCHPRSGQTRNDKGRGHHNARDDGVGDQKVLSAASGHADTEGFGEQKGMRSLGLFEGISKNVVGDLQADGIRSARDVLHVVPKDCVVCRAVDRIGDLRTGAVCAVFGWVVSVQRIQGKVPRVDVTVSVISSGDTVIGLLRLTFFRMPQSASWFQPQRRLTLVGPVSRYRGQWQMVHPRILSGDRRRQAGGARVVYPTCAGLSSQAWEQVVAAALSHMRRYPPADPVPKEIQQTYQLAALADAYRAVHEPPPTDDAQQWQRWCRKETPFHRRLAFEELLGLQIALSVTRNNNASTEMGGKQEKAASRAVAAAPRLPELADARELYRQFFPHEPTPCQLRVLDEIAADTAKSMPMTRLLHGDVGAGKTAVAAGACLHVVRAGLQCALMAPTEVLAKQHERTLTALFAPLGIRVALVTNQLKGKQRKACCAGLASGEPHVAVGTHALLSDDIQFKRLGLCIIDEQHRFGVAQRGRLRHKGERAGLTPHLLVMTATPIPRSLALVLYGNMRISTLRSLPAGRQPIATRLLRGEPEAVVRELTALLRRTHRKAYVVYPLIDESEKVDLADAKRGCKALQARLGEDNVLLLHSRLTPAQRQQVMERFAQGVARVLVATTVVEVGVDVPEATCMVVVHAERFGLSQLHQLRGRVGRGTTASECLLVAPRHVSDTAYERLKVLTETVDGFRIAEADLAARGPGDFVGKRQSGAPLLRCCDLLRHADLIEPARRVAADILQRDPRLAEPAHAPYRQTAAWQTLS